MSMKLNKSVGIWIITIISVVFGLISIKSGGSVLFVDGTFRENAGQYVPFVVWCNFLLGFAYIIASIGLWRQNRWAVWLSIFIVATTLIVFAAFGIYTLQGGLYELRTVIAMSFRIIVWTIIAIFSYRKIIHR